VSAGPAVLTVERSGGFAGLTRRASVPVAQLSTAEREAVDAVLGTPPAPPRGPDRFVYRLEMWGREALVQEDRLPPALQPLLDRLSGTWS
jgi:hypothetical protein